MTKADILLLDQMNELIWIQNGKFHQKVTSLQVCVYNQWSYPLTDEENNL